MFSLWNAVDIETK